jgi:hypothetical protein
VLVGGADDDIIVNLDGNTTSFAAEPAPTSRSANAADDFLGSFDAQGNLDRRRHRDAARDKREVRRKTQNAERSGTARSIEFAASPRVRFVLSDPSIDRLKLPPPQ